MRCPECGSGNVHSSPSTGMLCGSCNLNFAPEHGRPALGDRERPQLSSLGRAGRSWASPAASSELGLRGW